MHEALAILEQEADPVLVGLLTKDLKEAAKNMSESEVRYIVDLYYQIQRFRISTGNMKRAAVEEPNALLRFFMDNLQALEARVPTAMKYYAKNRRDGRWALSIHGIGPVLAAGLLAQIDIKRAPTAGHIWSFAGLNPEMTWKKGERRPFSARLKVLCWKVGQSFMKLRAGDGDIYGKVYEFRKQYEQERNARGEFKGYKLRTAAGTKEVDELPPFIIDARARRYSVKLFLSHLHHVMYETRFGEKPPKPYILTKGEHVHFIEPPNWPSE